ncbi:MAG: VWA domain-containing protein [Calditrichota bacterium]
MPQFANPWFLAIALASLGIVGLVWRRRGKRTPAALFTTLSVLKKLPQSRFKSRLRFLPPIVKALALILLAIALARPQEVSKGQDVHTEGIDLVVALDISASMLAQDFTPDRVGAAKQVAMDFINGRPNDRIGLVLFAKQAFTQCPLTIDHEILNELLSGVEVGLADPDNTAIGQALASALNRLKSSASKSKVVILLTDGENNYGLPPTTAAEAAEALGVRVYTIGVGTRGYAPYPARDVFGRVMTQRVPVSIDEDLLRKISDQTNGKYFRATDDQKLRQIFVEIDRLERTKFEVRAFRRYRELFYYWAGGALGLLALGWGIAVFITRGML